MLNGRGTVENYLVVVACRKALGISCLRKVALHRHDTVNQSASVVGHGVRHKITADSYTVIRICHGERTGAVDGEVSVNVQVTVAEKNFAAADGEIIVFVNRKAVQVQSAAAPVPFVSNR